MLQRIWVMSDLHGSYFPIEDFWNRNKDNINFSPDIDCIILLGDTGTNYYFNKKDKIFKKKLSNYPFSYFCIRGNHEARISSCVSKNPDSWHIEECFENTVYIENDYPHIKYALDEPAVYNIPYDVILKSYFNGENGKIFGENGKILAEAIFYYCKTLIIPGAYSVDKYYRLHNGWTWFSDEQLSEEEMEKGRHLIEQNDFKFDLILSHTCPNIYVPTDLFIKVVDQSTVDKTMERYLGTIEYQTNYKLWLFGHFHQFRIYPKHENSQVIMLYNDKAISLNQWLKDSSVIHKTY